MVLLLNLRIVRSMIRSIGVSVVDAIVAVAALLLLWLADSLNQCFGFAISHQSKWMFC